MRFAPEHRDAAWRDAVAPRGERIVGYVGRLAPEKQVDDLRALADLPGTRLVIVGDGPSRPALERAFPDAVFTGHLSGAALAQAMAGFDVFVHPGESETFGQTIQEALASGVPVVATGTGGPVDLVRSSIDGWLYRPGDLRDLRARVGDLVGDEGKRRAFAAAATSCLEMACTKRDVPPCRGWPPGIEGLRSRPARLALVLQFLLSSAAGRPGPPLKRRPQSCSARKS